MKYTKYLIDGKFINVDAIRSDKFYFKLFVRVIGILVALLGIAAIAGLIPMTILVDEYRTTKARLIHFKRNGYKL